MRAPDSADQHRISSAANRIAATLVVLASLVLPAGLYGVTAFSGLIADMNADARVAAESVQYLIRGASDHWQDKTAELDAIAAGWFHFDEPYGAERLRIVDLDGKTLSSIGTGPLWPTAVRSAIVSDGDTPAGAVEIERSLRTTIMVTALLVLLGCALAAGAYLSFHVVPLRTLRHHNAVLQRREAQLAFAETTLRAATEGSLDAILIVDNQAHIVTYTQRFIDLWSVPASLLQSGDDAPVLAAVAAQNKDPAAFRARVAYLYAHPDEESRDRIETVDGRIIDRYTRSLRGPNHAYLGRIWFFRDITETERAADALKQSEARFKAIFENARDGIGVLNLRTKMLFKANRSFCRMVGYKPEELPSLHLSDFHPPEAIADIARGIERQVRLESDIAENLPIRRKDGSIFFADVAATPVEIDGQPYLIGMFRDVTDRKTAEDRLKFANTLLQAEIESAPDAVLVVQDDLKTATYNRNFIDMFEIAPEAGSAHDADIILAAALPRLLDRDAFLNDIRTLRDHAEQKIHGREAALRNGRIVEYHGTTIRGPAHEAYGRIWFFRDITRRKEADAELRARDALLHAVAAGATALVTAPSLDHAIPETLATVSASLQVDRVLVMERTDIRHPPTLRYAWHGAGAKTVVGEAIFHDPVLMSPALIEWAAQLADGKVLTLHRSSAAPEFANFLDTLGIFSMLVVPITVDGKHWGQISFESCLAERVWRGFETEILTTLAELFGNVIQRERYVNEIANANRIVQNTPTILYRLRGVPPLPMIYVSQNIRLFGYDPGLLTGAPLLYQNLIHPEDIAAVREKQAQALATDAAGGSYEFRLLTGSGGYRWVENRYTVIRDPGGRIVEIEGLLIDITERKAAEDEITLLARTDPLTGLANRNAFIERLRQSFAAARRGAPAFALHYLDLDRFKDINDTLGHPVGDRFLVEVGRRLKGVIREVDLIGRIGGDEFALLQADVATSADAGTLAVKLKASLAEPITIDGNRLHGTLSIGIALFGESTASPDDLLAQADIALYRAKEEGRDQYRFHTAELDVEVREQVKFADELRAALRNDEFELHYQPQVDPASGRIVGIEALARWRHPRRGLLAARDFIPVAERAGLVSELGCKMLDRACAQMRKWRDGGIAPDVLAVNVSAAELKSADDYLDAVRSTLARWDLPAQSIELEITESTLARVTLSQNDVLERLRQLGVRLTIDDFGTRYSSLDYLRTYRVNRLKIPPRLTAAAAHDQDAAAMVRAIVAIARELDIDVIAHGIESQRQWDFLTASSPAAKVQGYFYSEPVSSDKAGDLLQLRTIAPPESASASQAPSQHRSDSRVV